MNPFLQEIFPTPLLIGKTDNLDICKKAEELAQKFKSSAVDASLVSEKWNYRIKSSSKEDFDEFGVTSYGAGSLTENEEWAEVATFVYDFANTMVRSVYDGEKTLSIINMWTTVYPKGSFVPEHIHSNSLLSGAFYVKAPENCGNIVFHDPSFIAKTMFLSGPEKEFPAVSTKFQQNVEAGVMVIFPSWLPHSTIANQSNEDRIMISFNMDMVDKPKDK